MLRLDHMHLSILTRSSFLLPHANTHVDAHTQKHMHECACTHTHIDGHTQEWTCTFKSVQCPLIVHRVRLKHPSLKIRFFIIKSYPFFQNLLSTLFCHASSKVVYCLLPTGWKAIPCPIAKAEFKYHTVCETGHEVPRTPAINDLPLSHQST